MPKFDPYHNTYSCPICSDDVSVARPIADKFVICTGCGSKLSVDVDAEFENGMWHDLTSLSPVEGEEEKHIRRMLEFAKKKRCSACSGTGKVITMGIEEECGFCEDGYYTPEEECEHQYAERTTAPLGVSCIKCGHFVGAWE